jgi:hypothetical protein
VASIYLEETLGVSENLAVEVLFDDVPTRFAGHVDKCEIAETRLERTNIQRFAVAKLVTR